MSDSYKLLNLLQQGTGQPVSFRLATIPAGYHGSGRPTLLFDGESAAGSRTYPYLSSYTPSAGDRVLVAIVGHGGVILGKVV